MGVDACAGAEAPSAVVGCEVAVNEVFHEKALAQAPVEEEVFGQEGGDGHAGAVVHGACVPELAHGGIDEGVACFAFAPGLEVRGVVFPCYVGVFGFEGFVHAGIMDHARAKISGWVFFRMGGRIGGRRGKKMDLPYIRPVD